MKYVILLIITFTICACGDTGSKVEESNLLTGRFLYTHSREVAHMNDNTVTSREVKDFVEIKKTDNGYSVREWVIETMPPKNGKPSYDTTYLGTFTAQYEPDSKKLTALKTDVHYADDGSYIYMGDEQDEKYMRVE